MSRKGIEYYVPMSFGITIKNADVIPLLIHMRWYQQATAARVHLRLYHPRYADIHDNLIESSYHKVLWDDVNDSEQFSHPIARLRLEGGTRHAAGCENLCALLEVDLTNLRYGKSITFSPVPFGVNGKPMLPFVGEELVQFLYAVKVVLGYGEDISWHGKAILTELERVHVSPDKILKFYNTFYEVMEKLDFMEKSECDRFVITRTVGEFEEIFSVKLPDIWD